MKTFMKALIGSACLAALPFAAQAQDRPHPEISDEVLGTYLLEGFDVQNEATQQKLLDVLTYEFEKGIVMSFDSNGQIAPGISYGRSYGNAATDGIHTIYVLDQSMADVFAAEDPAMMKEIFYSTTCGDPNIGMINDMGINFIQSMQRANGEEVLGFTINNTTCAPYM